MRRWAAVLIAVVSGCCCLAAQARGVALLIGISSYQSRDISVLEGPAQDVAALRRVLHQRWGFQPGDVRTLVDSQARRQSILKELDALLQRSDAGDDLLIYFSGHGTSALDRSASELDVPHGSGAFIAHDFDPRRPDAGGLIVGRHDLVPRITALEQAGRRLWVVMDSCYSGQAVRESQSTTADPNLWPPRSFQISRADMPARLSAAPALNLAAPPYPYRATAFLSAASEGETAKDVSSTQLQRWPTADGKPHGALTDALLRVLDGSLPGDLNGDGWLDLNELHRAITDFMSQRPYAQAPQRLPAVAEDAHGLGTRPVLSLRGVASAPQIAALRPLAVRVHDLPASLAQRLRGMPDVEVTGSDTADLQIGRSPAGSIDVIDRSGDRWLQLDSLDADRIVGQVRQLAWAKRLRSLAERHQRGVLPLGVEPSDHGGNLKVGDQMRFALRPDRQGWLLLVDIASNGQLIPLYPLGLHDTVALPAGQAWQTAPMRVEPPEGKDLQFAFLFDREPAELAAWTRLARRDDDASRQNLQAMLERMILAEARQFTFGHSEFRTWIAK